MARLPVPGSDSGSWGDILNEFLLQSLKADGKLQANSVTSSALAPNSVTNAALATNAVNANIIADGSITESLLDAALQTKVNASSSSGVASVAGKTGVVVIDKSDVGLSNVDNTADSAKPISSATQTALNAKANSTHTHSSSQISDATTIGRSVLTAADAAAARSAIGAGIGSGDVTLTGEQTLSGKTISGENNTFVDIPQSAITNLTSDLSGKAATSHTHAIGNVTNLQTTLDNKVSQTSANNQLYGTSSTGIQATYTVSLAPTINTIAARGNDGTIRIADPIDDADAATKLYVDTATTGIVTANGTQTLTNKTLVDPKINLIKDADNNTVFDLVSTPGADTWVGVKNTSWQQAVLFASSVDDDAVFVIEPKGAGDVRIYSSNPILAADGPNANQDLNLEAKGTGKVKVNNQPIVTSWMQHPFYTDPSRYEPWPQIMNGAGVWTMNSTDMPLTFFTPSNDMTVSNIITMGWNDTTQTGASVCKVAIYRVDDIFSGGNKMECIARSAHKPDRWNGAVVDVAPIVDNGAASPSPISSVNLTAGQQYAVGFLSVGHTGTPKISAMGGYRKNTLTPYIGYFGGGGHTDIPVHVTSGWLEEWTFVWFALS